MPSSRPGPPSAEGTIIMKLPIVLAMLLTLAASLPASAQVAAPRGITGGGTLRLLASDAGVEVVYACYGASVGAASNTSLNSATGCTIRNTDGDILAVAPGRTVSGNATATYDNDVVPAGSGVLQVCWEVSATYIDGELLTAAGCRSL